MGRAVGRVGPGQFFCQQSRVGSGQRFAGSGRVQEKWLVDNSETKAKAITDENEHINGPFCWMSFAIKGV